MQLAAMRASYQPFMTKHFRICQIDDGLKYCVQATAGNNPIQLVKCRTQVVFGYIHKPHIPATISMSLQNTMKPTNRLVPSTNRSPYNNKCEL